MSATQVAPEAAPPQQQQQQPLSPQREGSSVDAAAEALPEAAALSTARWVLGAFTMLNFFTYLDRGAVAGAMTAIQVDTHFAPGSAAASFAASPAFASPEDPHARLSATKCGMLISAFMVGYMLCSPFFALLGKGQRQHDKDVVAEPTTDGSSSSNDNNNNNNNDTSQQHGGRAPRTPPDLYYYSADGARFRYETDDLVAARDEHSGSDSNTGRLLPSPATLAALFTLYSYSPKRLILVGVAVWCAACAGTAAAPNYPCLLASRCLAGVGEAAYIAFTLCWLTTVSPPGVRSLYVGIYYAMIPVGTAAGMMAGGVLASFYARPDLSPTSHGRLWRCLHSWRLVFAVAAAAGVATMAVIARCIPEDSYYVTPDAAAQEDVGGAADRRSGEDADAAPADARGPRDSYRGRPAPTVTAATLAGAAEAGALAGPLPPTGPATTATSSSTPAAAADTVVDSLRQLLTNECYMLLVLGFSCYVFVVGAVSAWAIPLMAQGPLQWGRGQAAVAVGSITSVGGMVGTIAGGAAVDLMRGRVAGRPRDATGAAAEVTAGEAPDDSDNNDDDARVIDTCVTAAMALVAAAIPGGYGALLLAGSRVGFLVFFSVAVVLLFAVTAPVNLAVLKSVPQAHLRPLAVALSVLVIHAAGDFPSPTIAGALADWAMRRNDAALCRPWSAGPPEACHGGGGGSGAADASEAAESSSGGGAGAVNPNAHYCRWVAETGEGDGARGSCVYVYALRDSFLCVFAMLFATLPLWWAVHRIVRRRGAPTA